MRLTLFIAIFLLQSCGSKYQRVERRQGNAIVKFDLQGHRGARGLAPENTIPAFKKALDLGVTTLELDLAVTKDKQLVVSHEPWFSHLICLDSTGSNIGEEEAKAFNVFQMNYEEVRLFDCGSIGNPNFPSQESQEIGKPLLKDVILMAERFTENQNSFPVYYNIEIKSDPAGDNLYHPGPADFSELVYHTLDTLINWDRITIQSFDFRVLSHFNNTFPKVRLAALVYDDDGVEANLTELGFNPEIYSCYFGHLSIESVELLHKKGISVIPWTVNEISDMERLYQWGVDGLITDYPDRFWETQIDPQEVIEFIPDN